MVPENAFVLIDATRADFIDKDVIDAVNEFLFHAHLKNIKVEIRKSLSKPMHMLFNVPKTVNPDIILIEPTINTKDENIREVIAGK